MNNIKLFESKQIRTVWNEPEQKWYFVVADVVMVLTDTSNPSDYIKKMRKRDVLLSQGWGQIVTPPLLVDTSGGKQKLNCANAQGLLRIIQSIPSPKAEPFKLWLAQVGSDRLEKRNKQQTKLTICSHFNFMKKIFIGTVGYYNLRNHSIGTALLPQLQNGLHN